MSVALVTKCAASYVRSMKTKFMLYYLYIRINNKRDFNGYKLISRQSDLVIEVSELYKGAVKH